MSNINIINIITGLYKLKTKYLADHNTYFEATILLHNIINNLDEYKFDYPDLEKSLVYLCFLICSSKESEMLVDIIPKKYYNTILELKQIYLTKTKFQVDYDNIINYLDYNRTSSKKFMEILYMIPTHNDYLYISPDYVIKEIKLFMANQNSSDFINNCMYNLRLHNKKCYFNFYKNYIPKLNNIIAFPHNINYYKPLNKYKLDDYMPDVKRITHTHAKGSTCTVHLYNEYVIKKINKDDELNSGLKDILFSMRMDSDKISKIKNVFYEDNILYSVMLNYGKNLGSINMRKFDNTIKEIIIKDIALGLMYIHNQGIVHRDLTPWNICYGAYGTKIIDFSSSHAYRTNTSEYPVVCINNYRPFDVLLGNTIHEPSFDIWSFGCILYYIHTGSELFPYSEYDEDIIHHILYKLGGPRYNNNLNYAGYKYMKNEYWEVKPIMNTKVKFPYVDKILKFNPISRPNLYYIIEHLLPF